MAGTPAAAGGPVGLAAQAAAAERKRRKAAKEHAFTPAAGDSTHKAALPSPKGTKLLMGEFIVCFAILGLGTVVAPQGSGNGVPRLISRGSGLCLLFFILALISTGGAGAKRAADGLGGLVTVAYLVTSSDAKNVLTWIKGFYSTDGVTPTAQDYVAQKVDIGPLGGGTGEDVETGGPLGQAGERSGQAAEAGAAAGAAAGSGAGG